VRTHRGCLAILGWPLLLGGLLVVALALLTLVGMLKNTPVVVKEYVKERQDSVVRNLEKIPGLPHSVIDEFRAHGKVSEATLKSLPLGQRIGVGLNMLGYGLTLGRASEQGKAAFGIATVLLMIALVAGFIALVLGLILTARRSVLRCGNCSVVLDRA
jgi:hypothetical protein